MTSSFKPSPSRVSLVAALARNGVIGRRNALPWHLPEDLKRFKALTLGHPVVMGRKTFDSILASLGKPLPGRTNVVVSRSGTPSLLGVESRWENVHVAASLEEALRIAGGTGEIFIIGGAQLYALALPRADRLYLTEVLADVEGDVFFPAVARSAWREISREHGTGENGLAYDFAVYDRSPESQVR